MKREPIVVVSNGGFLEGDLYLGVICRVFVGVFGRVIGMLLLLGDHLRSKVQGRPVQAHLFRVQRGICKT